MGANLYSVGVLKIENSRKGDLVRVISPKGNIVGLGVQQLEAETIFQTRRDIAVKTLNSLYQLPALRELREFNEGLLFDQSYPSILVGHILNPLKNERILDMCAAPGGKTTHLAQLMNNEGSIIACDRSNNRLRIIENNAKRLGLNNIKTIQIDSRELYLRYTIKFDKILLDPPCTALGHRPKLYDLSEISKSYALNQYQIQLLKAASKILRKNGVLIYSTCTIPFYENELVIKYACENLGFKIEEQDYIYGSKGELQTQFPDLALCQRFYPDMHDTPGFFISLIKKKN